MIFISLTTGADGKGTAYEEGIDNQTKNRKITRGNNELKAKYHR
ncbi:hypothetical protein [Aquibacillus salsiterrae]|nr:hypothetical protein [Aquibacillus salsiterrae]